MSDELLSLLTQFPFPMLWSWELISKSVRDEDALGDKANGMVDD